jgi:hypothetical protein
MLSQLTPLKQEQTLSKHPPLCCHCCVPQQAWYCNTTCQQTAWRIHKNTCKQLRLAAALQQAEQRLRQELGLPEQQQQQDQQQQEAAAAAEFGSSFSAYPTAAELAAAVLKPEQVGCCTCYNVVMTEPGCPANACASLAETM